MKELIKRGIYSLIVRPWLRHIIGVKFQNKEIFKDLDQYIIVANHNSHFDTVSIMAALPGNKLKTTRAVASGDYFGKTKIATKLTHFFFNAILVKKQNDESSISTVDVIDSHLKKGMSLLLFPEGSRGKPGVISDFKSGIAVLLKNNPHIPFVPVYLDGFGRVLSKDKKIIIPLICKVRFGEPKYIQFPEVEMILDEVKASILDLKSKDERDRNKFDF
ncbi:MAG: lysophospholipid acyltransferase family protein [Putridiphycobacter sp.]